MLKFSVVQLSETAWGSNSDPLTVYRQSPAEVDRVTATVEAVSLSRVNSGALTSCTST